MVHHDWDPNDPADPVFIVLPDGNLSLAYQQPTSPSQKSIALTETNTPGSPRARPRFRLPLLAPASIRSCICAATPPQRAYSADSSSPRDTAVEAARAEGSSDSLEEAVTLAQAATGSLDLDAERGRDQRRSGRGRSRSHSTRSHSMLHARRGASSSMCRSRRRATTEVVRSPLTTILSQTQSYHGFCRDSCFYALPLWQARDALVTSVP